MLNVTELLATQVAERLRANYADLFGGAEPERLHAAIQMAHDVLTRIGKSDALYHNVEHTVHVTLVGIEILRGRHAHLHDLTPRDWLNVVVGLLCHDVGYVRGICSSDGLDRFATGVNNHMTWIASGTSDAALMPFHVDRGKRFVSEHFGVTSKLIDEDVVLACIERTRFPVPTDPWYHQTGDYPGLVRGADLIGQLSDPRYLNKLAAVFFEFEEIGFNQSTGYRRPGDLLYSYPAFFDSNVAPYIGDAEFFLRQTAGGRDVIASLYGNLEEARRPHTALAAANNG
ncbi:MAG: metal-dependent phosphohydrolase [Gammaproteobacteria bacterium]|nr:metal-dependent phosphohydrolase [Gammaproteobacteria bacterium]MBI5618941.1 metal-dependent phosphohydrolase [Gammaproteobacteria bacterium]